MSGKSRCNLPHFSCSKYLPVILQQGLRSTEGWLTSPVLSAHQNLLINLEKAQAGQCHSSVPLLSLTSCAQLPAQAHVNPCWLLLRDLKPPKEQSLDVTHAPDSDNTSPWRPRSPALAKGTAGNSSPALEPQILLEHKASLQKETLLQWVSGVTDLASSPHIFLC